MELLVAKLRKLYPDILFVAGTVAHWSPQTQQVTYCPDENEQAAVWALLHELGHALLQHTSYQSDAHLLQKEAAAWHKAQELATLHEITIDETYMQTCLDSYRDWLHKRSACPECKTHGIQQQPNLYRCLNCGEAWTVSSSRFCRPYRLKVALIKSPIR